MSMHTSSTTHQPLVLVPAVCEFCGDDDLMVAVPRPAEARTACPTCANGIARGQSGRVLRRPVPVQAVVTPEVPTHPRVQPKQPSVTGRAARPRVIGVVASGSRGLGVSLSHLTDGELGNAVRTGLQREEAERLAVRRAEANHQRWLADERAACWRAEEQQGREALPGIGDLPDLNVPDLPLDEVASTAMVDTYRRYFEHLHGGVPESLAADDVTYRTLIAMHVIASS